jgi:hypothetical protein
MIHHGSIEVIRGDENFGFPVTPLFPLTETQSQLPAAIKQRTGVTVGAIDQPAPDDLARFGPNYVNGWQGTDASGAEVIVRIWRSAEGA